MRPDRNDTAVAQKTVERLIPSPTAQAACSHLFSQAIQRAHQIAPNGWGITLTSRFIRLNVGRIEVLTMWANSIHIVLLGSHFPSELEKIPGVDLGRRGRTAYRTVEGSRSALIPADAVSNLLTVLVNAHAPLVDAAAQTPRHSMIIVAHSPGVLRYFESVLQSPLPNPAYSAAAANFVNPILFQSAFARFSSAVKAASGSDFLSFQEGLPAEWESYKEHVRNEARRLLKVQVWKRSEIGKGKILARAISAIEIQEPRNNLVAWPNRFGAASRSHKGLLDAQDDPQACRNLEQWFFDFFTGERTDDRIFDRFRELAGDRYDLIAYFFFVKDWKRFMPIAPTVFDEAFEIMRIPLITARKCSWENYLQYNAAIEQVRQLLEGVEGLGGVRLIDAHSYCWMLVRLKVPQQVNKVTIPLPTPIEIGEARVPKKRSSGREEDAPVVETDFFLLRDEARRKAGAVAQQIALESECRRLRAAGFRNPEASVEAVWDRPALGYDIRSKEADGTHRHIEVKAAKQAGGSCTFFVSPNELLKSRSLNNYYFYLVIGASTPKPDVKFFRGDTLPESSLRPVNYQAFVSCEE